MRLTRDQITGLRSKSPEGIYQQIRNLVRERCGVVERDELREALDQAIEAELLDERELRRLEEE